MGHGKLLSPQQVADWLGVSLDSVYRCHRQWGIPAIRVGRQLRFTETSIERYLERNAA